MQFFLIENELCHSTVNSCKHVNMITYKIIDRKPVNKLAVVLNLIL